MSGAGETYFAAYALFLGATVAQISLLAALPPIFGAIVQLLAVSIEARVSRRRTLILTGATMHAFSWLPIVWLPYMFPSHAVLTMIGSVVLYYGWVGLGAPLWASLIGELVPRSKHGSFFGKRTQVMSLSSFSTLMIAGITLQFYERRDETQWAFVLIFTTAGIARLLSAYYLARMHEPNVTSEALLPVRIAHQPRNDIRFMRFSAYMAAMQFAMAVAGPFFAIYLLNDLGFSYFAFAAVTAVSIATQFISLPAWGRLADIYGSRPLLLLTGALLPVVPTLWLVAPTFGWVLCAQALAGWAWSGFAIASGKYLYDAVPAENRSAYWAKHNLINTLGTCAGALLGGTLSTKFPHSIEVLGYTLRCTSGLAGLLLLSALLRASVQIAFHTWIEESRRRHALTLRAFALGMLRHNYATHLIRHYRRDTHARATSKLRA